MFRKILVAYDGSGTAGRALEVAMLIARLYDGELDLMSVQTPLPHYLSYRQSAAQRGEGEDFFRQLHQEAMGLAEQARVRLRPHLAQGHEVEVVIAFIKAQGSDLLVIGQVGYWNFLQRVWGGTAHNLARLSPCSVLVVK